LLGPKTEQPLGIRRRRVRYGLDRFLHENCDAFRDVEQHRGLVAPTLWNRINVSRQEIRSIGLENEAVEREHADCFAQFTAAPLVTDPTRHADVKIEIEAVFELLWAAGEAVRDPTHESLARRGENGEEVPVRGALV
jgi:hypothetical protein